ncbi:MAG: zinc D-Ala-D-Ala carboxypeptidase [Paracoccaceae bacterium]|jgi:zinc D-Ala-D-Ala carboxypeptidase
MNDIFEAASWRDVKPADWPWPNFSPEEIASKGNGAIKVSRRAMDRLQRLRDALGVPLIITSAYRDPAYNKLRGGVPDSQHKLGHAFDISVANVRPDALITAAKAAGFTSFGTYPKKGFVHIDDRSENIASWGKPFPSRVTRFAPEPIARPKTQAAAEGGGVLLAVAAAERVVTDATPFLPAAWVSGAFVAFGLASLGVVLWRAFGRRGRVE